MEKGSLEKAVNIFLLASTKIPENFDIKHLRWSKIDLSKETKNVLKKDTLRISEAVVRKSHIRISEAVVRKSHIRISEAVVWWCSVKQERLLLEFFWLKHNDAKKL